MSSHEGIMPHPRHVSIDLDAYDLQFSTAAVIAIEDPELFTEAQKLAASASAIMALAATVSMQEGGARHA